MTASLAASVAAAGATGTAAGRVRDRHRLPPFACTDDRPDASRLSLRVVGERATGHYAVPRRRPPALVVYAHGYGHTSYSWTEHLERTATKGFVAGLVAAGVPTDSFTVTTRDADSEKDTTITGYATDRAADGFVAPFAGHASEASGTHIVMEAAFDRLFAILRRGEQPGPYREFAVYGEPGADGPAYTPEP